MQITRWRRYGKDRLYVREDNGADIGWWDLVTDEGHCAGTSTIARLQGAVREWRSEHLTDMAAARGAASSATVPRTPGRELLDAPSRVTIPAAGPVPAPAEPPPPVPVPIVRDLIYRPPGEELLPNIAGARAEGQRPILLRRIMLGKDAYSTWERGAIGERLVWEELKKLDSTAGWGFLNSIPVGTKGSDIDHVVIGPAGVFTINAKYHQGARIWVGGDTIMVNGSRQPYVRNSRHEARRAAKLLTRATGFDVPVTGVVVPVNAGDLTIRAQPEDVHVINRKRLRRYPLGLPTALAPDAISAVFAAARLSSTWTT